MRLAYIVAVGAVLLTGPAMALDREAVIEAVIRQEAPECLHPMGLLSPRQIDRCREVEQLGRITYWIMKEDERRSQKPSR